MRRSWSCVGRCGAVSCVGRAIRTGRCGARECGEVWTYDGAWDKASATKQKTLERFAGHTFEESVYDDPVMLELIENEEADIFTTDVVAAKTACLANYYCTAVSAEYEGITTFRMQFTCRAPNHIGCQVLQAGANSYYRFDPDTPIGAVCWDDAPPRAPPPPPSNPPPPPCGNLIADSGCAEQYRYAGLCHTDEALRDCALTCGRCSGGCIDRDTLWDGYEDGVTDCNPTAQLNAGAMLTLTLG